MFKDAYLAKSTKLSMSLRRSVVSQHRTWSTDLRRWGDRVSFIRQLRLIIPIFSK